MTPDRRRLLADLLREWSRMDHGDTPNYIIGRWSRRELDAILDDVEYRMDRNPTIEVIQTKQLKDRKDTAKYWCTIHGPSDTPCHICMREGR